MTTLDSWVKTLESKKRPAIRDCQPFTLFVRYCTRFLWCRKTLLFNHGFVRDVTYPSYILWKKWDMGLVENAMYESGLKEFDFPYVYICECWNYTYQTARKKMKSIDKQIKLLFSLEKNLTLQRIFILNFRRINFHDFSKKLI